MNTGLSKEMAKAANEAMAQVDKDIRARKKAFERCVKGKERLLVAKAGDRVSYSPESVARQYDAAYDEDRRHVQFGGVSYRIDMVKADTLSTAKALHEITKKRRALMRQERKLLEKAFKYGLKVGA